MALCAFLMRPEPPTLCNPLHIVHVHIYFRCQVTVAPYLHDPRQIRPIAFGTRQVELHSIPMKRVCKYPLVPANLQLICHWMLQYGESLSPIQFLSHCSQVPCREASQDSFLGSLDLTIRTSTPDSALIDLCNLKLRKWSPHPNRPDSSLAAMTEEYSLLWVDQSGAPTH